MGLRNRLAQLLCSQMTLRGQSCRELDLSYLFHLNLENEGHGECMALVATLSHGKTNQHGRYEFGAALRNKNVEACVVGALALYLFYRFDIESEEFPDVSSPHLWYDIKVLRCSTVNRTGPMGYATQYQAVKKCFAALNLKYKAKTHVGRGSSVRCAELQGVSEFDLRRMGRWNSNAMEGCYLSQLPRAGMRALSGFSPTSANYFLPRGTIYVPPSLQKKIFAPLNSMAYPEDVAGNGFIKLMQKLRIVLLQDSIFLIDAYRGHPVWKHAVWKSDEYLQFKRDSLERLSGLEDPRDLQVEAALPRVCEVMQSGFDSLQVKMDAVQCDMRYKIEEMQAWQRQMTAFVESVQAIPFGRTLSTSMRAVSGSIAEKDSCDAHHNRDNVKQDTIVFDMCKLTSSVPALWAEWNDGLPGKPSVKSIEAKYGTKWRKASAKSKYFQRRKRIIDAVEKYASTESVCIEEAVAHFETIRGSKSLDWLCKNLPR